MSSARKTTRPLNSERLIHLNGEINEVNVAPVVDRLFELDNERSDKDILIFLNTEGGNITDGLLLVSIFKLLRSDVAIIVPSLAYSCGCIILSSATKGKRIVMPYSSAMLHSSVYALPEDSHILHKTAVAHQDRYDKVWSKMIIDNGYKHGKDGFTAEGKYYIGQEIVDAGLADVLIKSLDDLQKVVNI